MQFASNTCTVKHILKKNIWKFEQLENKTTVTFDVKAKDFTFSSMKYTMKKIRWQMTDI